VPRLPIRLAVAAGALALATAALTTTALATPTPRVTPRVAPCTAGQLVSWLNTAGNGYAGGVGYRIEFTNVSSATCTLFGYPGVSAVNRAGHQIGRPATRDAGAPATLVSIRPGSSAIATLLATDTGNYAPSACRPVTAFGLRVYGPGQTASEVLPYPLSVCSASSPTSIRIQVVR
jgi:hypothetical protein